MLCVGPLRCEQFDEFRGDRPTPGTGTCGVRRVGGMKFGDKRIDPLEPAIGVGHLGVHRSRKEALGLFV